MDSLARHLKMSKSTLYKHFASKEALIIALVEQVCGETEEQVREWIRTADVAPKEALNRLADLWRSMPADSTCGDSPAETTASHCQNRVELTSAGLNRPLREIIGRGVQGKRAIL